MNDVNLFLQGIYDQRTLKFLIQEGIKHFIFDFNPRSFNFIQEYVFLDLYKNFITDKNQIFLKFTNSKDPMINKLINDIKIINPNLSNIVFLFDEVDTDFPHPFFLNYSSSLKIPNSSYLKGIFLNFEFIENAYNHNSMNLFYSNLLSKNPILVSKKMILNINWRDNLLSSVFEIFEVDGISLSINSDVEVCYRNVDHQKIKKEIQLKKKYILA